MILNLFWMQEVKVIGDWNMYKLKHSTYREVASFSTFFIIILGWMLWWTWDSICHSCLLFVISLKYCGGERQRLSCRIFWTHKKWPWSQDPGSNLANRRRCGAHSQYSWHNFGGKTKITVARNWKSSWTFQAKMVLLWQTFGWQNENKWCEHTQRFCHSVCGEQFGFWSY